ncbi:hypothetical protein RI056_15000 [Komagataeibacter nataicola]|nr:hypothetical protein [Komagataeibacter nataicola]WNM08185.1 hypothetical protein RI056_15000 [Komagataeibacter nataicola]
MNIQSDSTPNPAKSRMKNGVKPCCAPGAAGVATPARKMLLHGIR